MKEISRATIGQLRRQSANVRRHTKVKKEMLIRKAIAADLPLHKIASKLNSHMFRQTESGCLYYGTSVKREFGYLF